MESLGISKVGQTVLARLIESQIWYQLPGSVALWLCRGEGLEKGQWPLLALMPDTLACPLHATGARQAASLLVLEPREVSLSK